MRREVLPVGLGEVVLTCGHPSALRQGSVWFKLGTGGIGPDGLRIPITAVKPDGTSVKSRWARACPTCIKKSGGDPNAIGWGSDYKHDGSRVELLVAN